MADGPTSAVADVNALDVGLAPSMAMGMCYVSMADSIGIAMSNAVSRQQRDQVVADAALVLVLKLIIAAGST